MNASPGKWAFSALDEILLDVAALIELSPQDRRIAENRYRLLKTHLERQSSPLRPYMIDGRSKIYAQGSVATSTTIVTGDSDDRFDLDAVVEADIPLDWSDRQVLDRLEEGLQSFPGVKKVVRCTRCVQLQFATMHMDVTVMDRRGRIAGERPGEIFHSPDKGNSYRVPSNPWGFTGWFRSVVKPGSREFAERLTETRRTAGRSRIPYLDEAERTVLAKTDQVPLPPAIPSHVDAIEAVALKLLKRFLNLRYASSPLKRPPSIWLAKRTGDLGDFEGGLTVQLFMLAKSLGDEMRSHAQHQTRPNELNPSYRPDRINDRWPRAAWPEAKQDMEVLAGHLDLLTEALNRMARQSQDEIMEEIDRLFGEQFGKEARRILADRYDRRSLGSPLYIKPATGTILAPTVAKSEQQTQPIRSHHFHPLRMPSKKG